MRIPHQLLIIYRGRKSGGKTVRISGSDDKAASKSQEKPFPTAEVIELRRLADEYKVIRVNRLKGKIFILHLFVPLPPFFLYSSSNTINLVLSLF